MLSRIAPYRKAGQEGRSDYDIGCIILTAPFFFEPDDWILEPEDFDGLQVSGEAVSDSR